MKLIREKGLLKVEGKTEQVCSHMILHMLNHKCSHMENGNENEYRI